VRRSTDVITVVAPDGRLTYVSPAARRVLGLAPEDLLGLPASALVGAANAARMTAYLDALGSGRPDVAEVDFEIALPSGERRIVGVIGSDQRASAVIGGIALTLRDATAERRAERAMLDDATRERQALSSEVHEGIAQELTGVALLVQSLHTTSTSSSPPTARNIEPILEQLGQTIGSVRRLAATLSPVHVAGGSLAIAVQQLAAEIGGRTGIEILTRSPVGEDVIPRPLREDAYRIVRTALIRAGRDATCTRVGVELETARGQLTIVLSGDGNRFGPDPAGADCELMQSILHRVQRLRGSLRVEQPGGHGERVVVQLPFEAAEAPAGDF
jgi:PAS domain S-box-containing protein